MKVKQLIKKLEKLNQDAEIILSSDEEGNSYHKLSEIYNNKLRFSDIGGYIDLHEKDEVEEEFWNYAKDCIILYPI